jgi:hypothetical protein
MLSPSRSHHQRKPEDTVMKKSYAIIMFENMIYETLPLLIISHIILNYTCIFCKTKDSAVNLLYFTLSSSEFSVDILSVPQEKATMLHNTRQQYENQDFSAHCYRFPVV